MPQILKSSRFWAALTLIVLGAFYFWQTRNGIDSGAVTEMSATETTKGSLPGAPVPGEPLVSTKNSLAALAAPSPMGPTGLTDLLPRDSEAQFQTAYRLCVPEAEKTYSDLKALLTDLESLAGEAVEKQWENYQFRLPNGEMRRVMLLPRDGVEASAPFSNEAWEMRYFGVDAEDLPISLPLPEGIDGINDLKALLALGQPAGHQVAERMPLPGEEELMIERSDGEIVDFQWRRPRGSLVCSTEVCRCLQGDDE